MKINTYILRIITTILILLMGVGTVWSQTHTEIYDFDGDGEEETYNVVYLKLGGATGQKDGSSIDNAVGSWANAYGKLPAFTGTTDDDRNEAWDHNIIVVCDQSGTLSIADANTGNRPATITGVWPWTDVKAADVKNGGRLTLPTTKSGSGGGTGRIGADTKFKYLNFGGSGYPSFSLYLHDCTFDLGCLMNGISGTLGTSNGEYPGRKAPNMQIFLFADTYDFTTNSTDGGWNKFMKKPVTLTIRSGKFGRILSCRITGTSETQIKGRYVIGNPSNPLMCVVNLDIAPETSTGEWNYDSTYPDDIAFLCAGMTQGAEYCDVQFNIKRGKIATLVGAMQGNSIPGTANANVKLSNSSFFGRTVTNITATNAEDVTIQRYYAACFGRNTGGQNGISNTAFYGQSILNMHGGKIVSGVYVSAGGISGLKSPNEGVDYHTNDQYIPYIDNTASTNYPYMGIKYQPYNASLTMPTVTSILNGATETIDLSQTITEMNIYGGEISGGVFGGSYGYSPEMPAKSAMGGAGSLWGETYVNIYGGTIKGGVYGGGEGTPNYYNDLGSDKTYDNKTTRDAFLTVASVYGNTNVNIYGGTFDNTGIYGAGKGVASQTADENKLGNEFLDIAKVYGNTNVTINPTDPDWTFTGNIYGGGAMGSVEGNTNVRILGGHINGSVYAASAGEKNNHINKGKIEGNPSATISGGTISQNVYGGGELASVVGNPAIIINSGSIAQNVYGGGLGDKDGGAMAAQVNGNTNVKINGGSIGIGIYGGGKGVVSTNENEFLDIAKVYGNTNVTIDADEDWEYSGNLFGGGALGSVEGNTNVIILGGKILGDVFGAGEGEEGHPAKARVTGTTKVIVGGE